MASWSTLPASALSLADLADLFTRGFAGYLVPIQMPTDALAERVCAEDIHLGSSRVLLVDGEPAGLGLIARRGRESRLAAMGIVEGARGRGAGRKLMTLLLDEARQRRDLRMRLEVFESNAPARALYERMGFRTVTRLVGWDLPAPSAVPAELREVESTDFARVVARGDAGPLPWQLAPASLSAPPASARCFSLDEKAWAYVSVVAEKAVAVRGVLTLPEQRRRGHARRLLSALAARFPGRAITVPPLIPEAMGAPFFEALGFKPAALSQLEMALSL